MIHHSDAGCQYASMRFTETLALQELSASSAASAMFTTTRWPNRSSASQRTKPSPRDHHSVPDQSKPTSDVEDITLNYTDWSNNQRLHNLLDNAAPEQFEQAHYALQTGSPPGDATNKKPA